MECVLELFGTRGTTIIFFLQCTTLVSQGLKHETYSASLNASVFPEKIATFQMSIASAQNLLLIINLYHDEAWDISDLLGAKLRL